MRGLKSKDYIICRVDKKIKGFWSPVPYPRDHTKKDLSKLYLFIAKWLLRNGIYQVAGPVCSGALMSYAISVASKGNINAAYLQKYSGKYKPSKHDEGSLSFASYVLVDDIISSGAEMRNSIRIAQEQNSLKPSAILCFNQEENTTFNDIPIFAARFVRGE